MYIGIGTVVLIIVLYLVFLLDICKAIVRLGLNEPIIRSAHSTT